MEREYLIQLTQNLYRLTLLFPKKEPLRYKMREMADDILTDFCKAQNPEIFKNLETLDSFFEVAKNQNWASPAEILKVQQDYSNLKEELKSSVKSSEAEPRKVEKRESSVSSAAERQEKILEFLKENGRAQVWQVKQILPEVTKRTLRRDFEHLLNQGIIERIGERNDTFYQLKVEQA